MGLDRFTKMLNHWLVCAYYIIISLILPSLCLLFHVYLSVYFGGLIKGCKDLEGVLIFGGGSYVFDVWLNRSHSAPVWLGWGPGAASRRFLMLLVLLLLPAPVWTMMTRLELQKQHIMSCSQVILDNHTGEFGAWVGQGVLTNVRFGWFSL